MLSTKFAYLVKVISPSLSPITESCIEKEQSTGKKNNILSSSCPSCCPLLKSKMQSCIPSLQVAVDDKPIYNPFFYTTLTWKRIQKRDASDVKQPKIKKQQRRSLQTTYFTRLLLTSWDIYEVRTQINVRIIIFTKTFKLHKFHFKTSLVLLTKAFNGKQFYQSTISHWIIIVHR